MAASIVSDDSFESTKGINAANRATSSRDLGQRLLHLKRHSTQPVIVIKTPMSRLQKD